MRKIPMLWRKSPYSGGKWAEIPVMCHEMGTGMERFGVIVCRSGAKWKNLTFFDGICVLLR
jgi:hypothetical protein